MGRRKGTDKSASAKLRTKIIDVVEGPNRLSQSDIARQLDCSAQYVSYVIRKHQSTSAHELVDVSDTMAAFRALGWKNVDIFGKLANETRFADGKVSLKTLGKWARGESKASRARANALIAALNHAQDFQDEVPASRSRRKLPSLSRLKKANS